MCVALCCFVACFWNYNDDFKKVMREMDPEMFGNIEAKATFTGNLKNGIKDGIRDEW